MKNGIVKHVIWRFECAQNAPYVTW